MIGSDGCENTNKGKAKLKVEFLWFVRSFLRMNLIISIAVKPAVTEANVTTFGKIFCPLINIVSLSAGSIR